MELSLRFFFGRPKTHYAPQGTDALVLRTDAPVYVCKVHDTDNLVKLMMHAMVGALFEQDDRFVVHCRGKEVWYAPGRQYQSHPVDQKSLGFTNFRLTQYFEGTYEPGCNCEICKDARKGGKVKMAGGRHSAFISSGAHRSRYLT